MDSSTDLGESFSEMKAESDPVGCEIHSDTTSRVGGVNGGGRMPTADRKLSWERGLEEAQDTSTQSGSNVEGSGTQEIKPGKIKKKHRRGSKRKKPRKPRYKWKPYHKLTWDEKRKLDERDSIKAERKREEIKRKGRPIAPYNTTQFLMDEHDTIEPDLGEPDHILLHQPSVDASHSDFDESSSEEGDFYEKDFTEAYEMAHVETLHALSKNDLVHDYLELEHKIEEMEKVARKKSSDLSDLKEHEDPFSEHVSVNNENVSVNSENKNNMWILENKRLRDENEQLRADNLELKKQLLIYQNIS